MMIDRSKARYLCKYLLDNLSWDIIWLYQLWCSSLGRMIWFCSASSNDLAADHPLPPPPWLLNPQRPRENLRQRGIWQISPADRAWEQRRRKRAANWLDAGNQEGKLFCTHSTYIGSHLPLVCNSLLRWQLYTSPYMLLTSNDRFATSRIWTVSNTS